MQIDETIKAIATILENQWQEMNVSEILGSGFQPVPDMILAQELFNQ